MGYWRAKARCLPRCPEEPFHSAALVEQTDAELDLFDRGRERFSVLLQVIEIARGGAEVRGVVHCDEVFRRQSDSGPPPVPLPDFFASQEDVRASVLLKLRRVSSEERVLLWAALEKEVVQGFGVARGARPAAADIPDVFAHRFVALLGC